MEEGIDKGRTPNTQSALAFFSIYAVVGVSFWFARKGGLYTLVAPLVTTFIAVPVFDLLMGLDARNPPESPPGRFATVLFRFATWLAVPAMGALLLWGVSFATRPSASLLDLAGAVLAVGIIGGALGITVAHELIHRSSPLERTLGGVLLVMVSYLHWAIEHVAGHHRRVATPEDPATARYGESLPAFMVRSVRFGFMSAWRIEAGRNARRGLRSPWRNRVLWSLLASSALATALGLAFGPAAVGVFVGESAVAIGFLEIVNYIEHYGLERRLVEPGVYERVTALHSWNSAHRLTNALLFNLQRHSDHHVSPTRPYYRLRQFPESPQLPTGYAGMALLAMVPPLWRRIMHPRLEVSRTRLDRAHTGDSSAGAHG